MKYRTAKVIAHPRAGSHYLAKLLNINFFHFPNYLSLYAGHSNDHKQHLKANSTAVFYVYRNNADTLKSIYKLRDRFGLVADNFEEFLNTKLSIMGDGSIKSEAVYSSGDNKKIVTQVDSYLRSFDMLPEEYLEEHKKFWLDIKCSNYMVIAYEDLIFNFQDTMYDIAMFLNSNQTVFKNETSKIGWYDKKDKKKNFLEIQDTI